MNIALISTNTFPSEQGLRTISGCLKQAGHKVKIIFLTLSENYKELYSKEILEQLKQATKDTQLVGLSSMGSTANRASQIIDMFQNNNVPVIWGGPHPTFFPQDCFKRCNIICVGEGEEAFVELAEKLEKKQEYHYEKLQDDESIIYSNQKDVDLLKRDIQVINESLEELEY